MDELLRRPIKIVGLTLLALRNLSKIASEINNVIFKDKTVLWDKKNRRKVRRSNLIFSPRVLCR